MTGEHFSQDTVEFLSLLQEHSVEYLIVGGEAVIYYGHARLTGDVDIFYANSESNSKRLFQVLYDFWGGDIPGIGDPAELIEPGVIVQFGVPPNRIDLINRIDGVHFQEAWSNRVSIKLVTETAEIPINYIGLNELIKNKAAANRSKDLTDLEFLSKISQDKKPG